MNDVVFAIMSTILIGTLIAAVLTLNEHKRVERCVSIEEWSKKHELGRRDHDFYLRRCQE